MFYHRRLQLGKRRGIALAIANTMSRPNLFILAGSPTTPVNLVATLNAGVIAHSVTNTLAALDVGQFPAGSVITLYIDGEVQAGCGDSTNLNGGDAIKADYPNQTVLIYVRPGGKVLPGGGAGGRGGNGGTGGQGGQGSYENISWGTFKWDGLPLTYWDVNLEAGVGGYVAGYLNSNDWLPQFSWDCYEYVETNPYYPINRTSYGSYRRGAWRMGHTDGVWDGYYYSAWYDIGVSSGDVITSGGAGGSGGNGGAGGRGRGYSVTPEAGPNGSTGNGGGAPGTNAGWGGTGGTGGKGGNGGEWGESGTAGSNGATGSAGANGNYTAGSAGSAGASGQAGGLGGRYLVKGTANVTFINDGGTVVGRLG